MGQKSNPALLRLGRTNQQWVSCWYNDHNYAAQFLDDYVVYTYIQNCGQQLKKIPPSLFIKRNRGQIQILLFSPRSARRTFLPRMNRRKVSRTTNHLVLSQLSNSVRSKKLIPIAGFVQDQVNTLLRGRNKNFLGEKAHILKKGVLMSCVNYSPLMFLYSQLPPKKGLLPMPLSGAIPFYPLGIGCSNFYKSHLSTVYSLYRNTTSSISLGMRNRSTKITRTGGKRARTPLKNHIEFSIWAQFHYRCKFYFLKCPSIHQNPLFLTSQIVYLLQERISFRQMKHRLIEEVSKDVTIKGIRILCSGRVAARSKKAQKARKESIQWGETSLNAFSELVHFANKKAQTTFGKIGVKLWICYKQPRHSKSSTFAKRKAPQLYLR